jgi:hypothetical protein
MDFPVLGNDFPVLSLKILCSISLGNSAKDAGVSGDLTRRGACDDLGFANFPVFFPVSREFGAETASHRTASSAKFFLIKLLR